MTATITDKPKFQHDCNECKFLGHAKNCDWYVCDKSDILGRSIIARHGNKGYENASCALFVCVELTSLEKHALSLGLELTEKEEKKLLKILLRNVREKFSLDEVRRFMPKENDGKIGNSDYFSWNEFG